MERALLKVEGLMVDKEFCLWNETRRMHSLRMQMVEEHPFWGYLLLQVRLVPAPDLPAFACTDCARHVWFNPMLTRHLDHAQAGFVLAHEVAHQLLASLPRMRGRELRLWNCATDYAINRLVDGIRRPGTAFAPMYRLPNGKFPGLGEVRILLDRRFDGMSAEAIYHVLNAEQLPSPVPSSFNLPLPGQGEGSSARIGHVDYHGGGVDVHLPDETLTDDVREELARRVDSALSAWEGQDQRGACPADYVTRIQEARQSVVPWRRLLRSYAGQALTRDDWSLARPNARYLEQGIVVPGPYGEGVGSIVISVDSSGSMSPALLEQVASELEAIAALVDGVTILVSDTDIRQVVEQREVARFLKEVQFRGGGGTDHRPVFKYLAKKRITPDLFIGLTDLATQLPPDRPPFPVIWVVPSTHATAPWGQVVVATDLPA